MQLLFSCSENLRIIYPFIVPPSKEIPSLNFLFLKTHRFLNLLSTTGLASWGVTGEERKGIELEAIRHICLPLITVLYLYFSYFLPLSLPRPISVPRAVLINWDGVWGKLRYRYELPMAKRSPAGTHHMESDPRNGQFSYVSHDTPSFIHPFLRLLQFLFSPPCFHVTLFCSLFIRKWKRCRNTEGNRSRCETP